MTCNLSLRGPHVTVGVEYAVAEEFMQDGGVTVAFDVVKEVVAEEVVEVGGVGGADAVGEVEEAVDLEGERWGGGEHVGDPVVEAVAVAEEADEVADEWVGLGTWCGGTVTGEVVEDGGEKEDW
ncbi:hypothetical protein HanRHA438_Chr13g0619171 [Helianthus annuus]|nr:hypothetical protein HanIR_Chr13g0661141 [Helianthus annuus]KAJ0860023.1 hypothetical protein HanRHA438_Chr13g0619171 [Helianthus annuus]